MSSRRRQLLALQTVALFATGLWFGGLLTLGAVVAPLVFRNVPMPFSADAMSLVFRRFDQVALACAVVLLGVEAWGASLVRRTRLADAVRGGAVLLAMLAALVQGLVLSPHIQRLHEEGAVRGLGPGGQELEAVHRQAEATGKAQVALVAVAMAFYVLVPRRQENVDVRDT